MVDLKLDVDEGIVLEASLVTRVTGNRERLDSLILTNKNIYGVKKKGMGLFSKSEPEITKRPLSDIKMVNGQLMVDKVWDGVESFCLQVQYLDGRVLYSFDEITGRVAAKWNNEIHKLLTGNIAPAKQSETVANAVGALSGFAANLKSAAGSAMQTATESAKQFADSAATSVENVKDEYQGSQSTKQAVSLTRTEDAAGQSQNAHFCANCGRKLLEGAKFCPDCGTKVGTIGASASQSPADPVQIDNPTERQQEFAGVILKCPNCGSQISQTTVICPDCGYRITGQAAVSSIQKFSDQLMKLEMNRKRDGLGQMFGMGANPTDKQKLSLIQSFPIPNTIDDIQEFVLLAVGNIDVSLSKASMKNKYQKHTNNAWNLADMARTISDAWVGKLQQAYQKAKISFPNDPAFEAIRQVYVSKMKELKLPID